MITEYLINPFAQEMTTRDRDIWSSDFVGFLIARGHSPDALETSGYQGIVATSVNILTSQDDRSHCGEEHKV
jgi:hypothetical protein